MTTLAGADWLADIDTLPLAHDLMARIREREERTSWKRVRVSTAGEWEDLVRSLEQYRQVFYQSDLSCFTVMDTRTRHVFWRAWPCMPGELAREYLRMCYEESPHGAPWPAVRGRLADHRYWRRRLPLLCRPVRHRALAYLDVRHAYWQLMTPYQLDVTLAKNRRIICGLVPFRRVDELVGDDGDDLDTLEAKRSLRLAIPGILFAKDLTSWHYGVQRSVPVTTRWANPSLYRIVCDTLTAVCREIDRRFTLHAWLTDACIVPRRQARDVAQYLAEEWGLVTTVKGEGMGDVYSVTSYRVGDKWSEDFHNGNARRVEVPTDMVGKCDVRLMKRLRREAVR